MKAKIFLFSVLILIVGNLLAQDDNCTCCTEAYRAFDFWIGEWDVYQPDGTLAGTNTIEREHNGCMLQENWVSAKYAFTGSSTSFYNKQKDQWEQLWVDSGGSHLHLRGNREGNQMILLTDEIPREDKPPYINRISWTKNDDDTVRQLWEILVDGKVENIVFDGLYKKKS